jgi:hypothetical protein
MGYSFIRGDYPLSRRRPQKPRSHPPGGLYVHAPSCKKRGASALGLLETSPQEWADPLVVLDMARSVNDF